MTENLMIDEEEAAWHDAVGIKRATTHDTVPTLREQKEVMQPIIINEPPDVTVTVNPAPVTVQSPSVVVNNEGAQITLPPAPSTVTVVEAPAVHVETPPVVVHAEVAAPQVSVASPTVLLQTADGQVFEVEASILEPEDETAQISLETDPVTGEITKLIKETAQGVTEVEVVERAADGAPTTVKRKRKKKKHTKYWGQS